MEQEGIPDRIRLTGYRDDIPAVMAALDVLVTTSVRTDGIPQAGLQVMVTGFPLVGTDIGESRRFSGTVKRDSSSGRATRRHSRMPWGG